MWNIFKVKVEFCFSRTVYLQSCRQACSSVKDKINIPLAYLKTFTGSCIILFKPNFCVVHATTNESRENHAIDFPIVHTSFWKPRPVFVFGMKRKWETTGVIFTEAPWLTAPHRNLSLSIICLTTLSFQHSERALETLLPQNKELCFHQLWVRKEKNIASLYKHANNIYISKTYFRFSSKGSPFTLL